MFTMDRDYVHARFHMISMPFGAPAAMTIEPGESMPVFTSEAFDAANHDEELFLKHLVGKTSDEALQVFLAFQPQLKIPGLRHMKEKDFRAEFLSDYSE